MIRIISIYETKNIYFHQAKQMELNEHKKAVEKEEKEAWDQELLATRREVLKREVSTSFLPMVPRSHGRRLAEASTEEPHSV